MIRPTLFMLHGLGMSARFWDAQIEALGGDFDCVALDLPGFGASADATETTVEEMADWLAREIRARAPSAWVPIGHSMGGKIATLVAARAEGGEAGLDGLAGVVLLAASPPSPEPMEEKRRAEMIGWFADGAPSVEDAVKFVDANVAGDLPPAAMEQAVEDVRRTGRAAWMGWLERGSREDWSDAAAILQTPALIVAGVEDGDLGEASQRRVNLPHYADASLEVVADAAHFLPLEQPDAVAGLISRYWRRLNSRRALPAETRQLVVSDRTSARTRDILLDRMPQIDGPPRCLSVPQLEVLAAVVDQILPGCGDPFDLARRIDAALATGEGDGWRFAELPDDADAWRFGLDTLAELVPGFPALEFERRDHWLERMAAGSAGIEGAVGRLSGDRMTLWFEDVRAETVRTWMSHPLAMARIGYDGFANGGDGPRMRGFPTVGAGGAEAFEPASMGDAER